MFSPHRLPALTFWFCGICSMKSLLQPHSVSQRQLCLWLPLSFILARSLSISALLAVFREEAERKRGARRRGYLCYGELFSVFVLCMCPAIPSHVPACVWTRIKLSVQPWQQLPWRQCGDGPRERLQVTERETERDRLETERGVSPEVTVYFENDRLGKEVTRTELSSWMMNLTVWWCHKECFKGNSAATILRFTVKCIHYFI